MDSLTAGIILILLQVCIALVMAGVFFAAPTEKSTRCWALAGTYIALGVLIALLNLHQPRAIVLMTGAGLIMAGLIYQWHGILAFYKKQPPKWSWLICVFFLVFLGLALSVDASVAQRSILFSLTTLLPREMTTKNMAKMVQAGILCCVALGIFLLPSLETGISRIGTWFCIISFSSSLGIALSLSER